jgi:hypothetical protein
MRSGDLDTLIRLVRPGALAQQGRSRVAGADVLIAEVPARMVSGIGQERFASAENAATAPAVFVIRRSPEVEDVDAGDALLELEENGDGEMVPVRRYDIKSARPWPQDPRRTLEISGVRNAG